MPRPAASRPRLLPVSPVSCHVLGTVAGRWLGTGRARRDVGQWYWGWEDRRVLRFCSQSQHWSWALSSGRDGRPQEHHGTATSLGRHRSHLTPSAPLPARRLDPLLGGQGVRPDRIPPLGAPSCTPRGCRRGLCPGGAPASPHCGPSPSTLHAPCPRCTPHAAPKPHKTHACSASWAPPAPRSAWPGDPGGHFAASLLPPALFWGGWDGGTGCCCNAARRGRVWGRGGGCCARWVLCPADPCPGPCPGPQRRAPASPAAGDDEKSSTLAAS